MLTWTMFFLVVAIIAALLGFGGLDGVTADIARVLFLRLPRYLSHYSGFRAHSQEAVTDTREYPGGVSTTASEALSSHTTAASAPASPRGWSAARSAGAISVRSAIDLVSPPAFSTNSLSMVRPVYQSCVARFRAARHTPTLPGRPACAGVPGCGG